MSAQYLVHLLIFYLAAIIQFPYFSFDEVPMLWTVDFFVLQEDAVALTGTHEVVVTGARGEAAANCGP